MAGAIIGWFFLGLLVLLLLLLLLPVAVYVSYGQGQFVLAVRVFFIKIRVLSLPAKEKTPEQQRRAEAKKENREQKKQAKKEKAEAKRQRKKQKEQQEEPPAEKPKKSISEILNLVKRIASSAGRVFRFVFKMLRIKDVSLVIPVYAKDDAAKTALNCGRLQMLLGSVRGALENLVHIRYKQLVILPDFANQYSDALSFSCKIVASPVIMLIAGGMGLKRFLTYNREARKVYRQYGAIQQRRERQAANVRQQAAGQAPNTAGDI